MIVTFCCQKDKVFIFTSGKTKPLWPYKTHKDLESAKKYLKSSNPKIIEK